MPRRTTPQKFRRRLIAIAASAALAPASAWALDLANSPPGTVEPYVAPNVIISIDDSGSMNFRIDNGNAGQQSITAPGANGVWDNRAARVNLADCLRSRRDLNLGWPFDCSASAR